MEDDIQNIPQRAGTGTHGGITRSVEASSSFEGVVMGKFVASIKNVMFVGTGGNIVAYGRLAEPGKQT
jgi:hypothetical protein